VDFARSRPHSGGNREPQHVALDEALTLTTQRGPDLVALDEALDALTRIDPRQSRIVELRFFGGLRVEDTADALEISPRTVVREWNSAKAWLYHELNGKHIGLSDEIKGMIPRPFNLNLTPV
jgi:DNA-directed RNA polymerase specialized sigma24 family protein